MAITATSRINSSAVSSSQLINMSAESGTVKSSCSQVTTSVSGPRLVAVSSLSGASGPANHTAAEGKTNHVTKIIAPSTSVTASKVGVAEIKEHLSKPVSEVKELWLSKSLEKISSMSNVRSSTSNFSVSQMPLAMVKGVTQTVPANSVTSLRTVPVVTSGHPLTSISIPRVSIIGQTVMTHLGSFSCTMAPRPAVAQLVTTVSSVGIDVTSASLTSTTTTNVLPAKPTANATQQQTSIPSMLDATKHSPLKSDPTKPISVLKTSGDKLRIIGSKAPVTLLGPFDSPSKIPKVLPQMKVLQAKSVSKDGKPVIHLIPYTTPTGVSVSGGMVTVPISLSTVTSPCVKTKVPSTIPPAHEIKPDVLTSAPKPPDLTTGCMFTVSNAVSMTTSTTTAVTMETSVAATISSASEVASVVASKILPSHGDQIIVLSRGEESKKVLEKLQLAPVVDTAAYVSPGEDAVKKKETEGGMEGGQDKQSESTVKKKKKKKKRRSETSLDETGKQKRKTREDGKEEDVGVKKRKTAEENDNDSVLAKILVSNDVDQVYARYRGAGPSTSVDQRSEGEMAEGSDGSGESDSEEEVPRQLDSSCDNKSDDTDATIAGGLVESDVELSNQSMEEKAALGSIGGPGGEERATKMHIRGSGDVKRAGKVLTGSQGNEEKAATVLTEVPVNEAKDSVKLPMDKELCENSSDSAAVEESVMKIEQSAAEDSSGVEMEVHRCTQEADVHSGTQEANVLSGTQEADVHSGTQEADVHSGTQEADVHSGTQEADVHSGTQEADVHSGTQEADVHSGTQEADVHSGTQEADVHSGTQEADVHSGTQEADVHSGTQEAALSNSLLALELTKGATTESLVQTEGQQEEKGAKPGEDDAPSGCEIGDNERRIPVSNSLLALELIKGQSSVGTGEDKEGNQVESLCETSSRKRKIEEGSEGVEETGPGPSSKRAKSDEETSGVEVSQAGDRQRLVLLYACSMCIN